MPILAYESPEQIANELREEMKVATVESTVPWYPFDGTLTVLVQGLPREQSEADELQNHLKQALACEGVMITNVTINAPALNVHVAKPAGYVSWRHH